MARDLHLNYVRIGSLSVAKALDEFIEREAAPETSISAEAFWVSACCNCASVATTAIVAPVYGLESLLAKIGSGARRGVVNIPMSSSMNETNA
jgi:hypothetical protein